MIKVKIFLWCGYRVIFHYQSNNIFYIKLLVKFIKYIATEDRTMDNTKTQCQADLVSDIKRVKHLQKALY